MNDTKQISLALRWVPPAELRGNSRAHWRRRAAAIRTAREIGQQHGHRALAQGPPIRGAIEVRFEVFYKNNIDLDNLLIGYKPIIDGLADSGAIDDDRNIKKMSYQTHEMQRKYDCNNYQIGRFIKKVLTSRKSMI